MQARFLRVRVFLAGFPTMKVKGGGSVSLNRENGLKHE
jgi:hypothetical protein